MYVLVTYDVADSGGAGARRLRRVAKICTQYGQRVQLSVFECLVDPGQYTSMRHALEQAIDPERDSLRLYNLGKHWERRVDHIGVDTSYNPEGTLLV